MYIYICHRHISCIYIICHIHISCIYSIYIIYIYIHCIISYHIMSCHVISYHILYIYVYHIYIYVRIGKRWIRTTKKIGSETKSITCNRDLSWSNSNNGDFYMGQVYSFTFQERRHMYAKMEDLRMFIQFHVTVRHRWWLPQAVWLRLKAVLWPLESNKLGWHLLTIQLLGLLRWIFFRSGRRFYPDLAPCWISGYRRILVIRVADSQVVSPESWNCPIQEVGE